MPGIIECVPNFSEGRDPEIIRAITARIEGVAGATLLHVDRGQSTNRTVVTFAGAPEAVVEAAFHAIAAARDLIDMRRHTGTHPRLGATDVCPLVPIQGITLEETAGWARQLAERVGRELAIPVYLYEAAQSQAWRRDLATIRGGEYEGLAVKQARPEWRPDCGPAEFNPRTGATVIGARGFLVAYNVNLNTTSTRWANAVAFDVREIGRPVREGDSLTGRILTDSEGNPRMRPGTLKAVKAIGWYIPEYGTAQVSMNLTDLGVTPLHVAFAEVCRRAEARGLRVTGSELIGLIPLSAMLDAGRHFLRQQHRSLGVPESDLIQVAVKSLGLNELAHFRPEERIIEYRLRQPGDRPLAQLSVEGFVDETGRESPAPGGGSVAALLGALGAALGTMVANLSAHKRGWEDRWEGFSRHAEEGQRLKAALLNLVDEDTRAFNGVMAAMGLPRKTTEERAAREEALRTATGNAVRTPLRVMQLALELFPLLEAMARDGNPASVSDAAVGALAARAAVRGAGLNVRINLPGLGDPREADRLRGEVARLEAEAEAGERTVVLLVEAALAPRG